jgi:hypothetical protein
LFAFRGLNVGWENLIIEILVPSSREGVDFADRHESVYISIGHCSTFGLKVSNEVLEDLD